MSKKVKCCECDSFMGWALPRGVDKDNYEYAKEVLKLASTKKQIPRKPIDKTKPDDTASLAYENCNIVVCPTCGGRLKLKSKGKYCDKCGQKLDWGGSEKSCQTNLHQK